MVAIGNTSSPSIFLLDTVTVNDTLACGELPTPPPPTLLLLLLLLLLSSLPSLLSTASHSS